MEKGYVTKGSLILFFFAVVLISLPLVNAATSNDFVKIDDGDREIYTHKDLVNSRYLVGSDEIFYGSKEGEVTIKLYLKDKVGSGNYKIGLRTKTKNITVKSIGVEKSPIPVVSTRSKFYDYPELIYLDSSITEVNIVIEFDPLEIGLREEFDIILYNDKGDIITIYDPFISGFDFRQKLTLDTTQLGADVTADHAILVYLDPTNTDFWTGDTLGTGNGITFAQSDETTQIDFNAEAFNNADNNAWFWVEVTETFTSATDLNQWMYYGGPDTDFSDGSGAYPSTYTAVYHLQEPSGTLGADSTSNGFNLTHVNTPTLGVQSQIDTGVTYTEAGSEHSLNATLLDDGATSVSVSVWVKKPSDWNSSATDEDAIFDKTNSGSGNDNLAFAWKTDGSILWKYVDGAAASHTVASSKTTWAANTWFHLIVTMDSATNDMNFYVNGSTTDGGTLNEAMPAMVAGTTADFFASARTAAADFSDQTLDEFKVFRNTSLSPFEAELLFLSESNQLITFGAQETNFAADFIATTFPTWLDTNSGVVDLNLTLTDASNPSDTETVVDWNYFIDGVRFYTSTVDGNTSRLLTSVGDFNISLIITGSLGSVSQEDQTISVVENIQDLSLVLSNSPPTVDKDLNFTVSWDVNFNDANVAYWQFDSDTNVTNSGSLTNPHSETHTFTTGGTKTITVTLQQTDVNGTTIDTNSTISFDVNVTGFLNFTVFDENAGTAISGASIDFNSGTYTTDGSGFISIPLDGISTGEKTITIDVNSSFPQREFVFDMNQFSTFDLNFLMLQSNNGSSRSYQIFQPDKTTKIINSFVEWRRNGPVDNGISQRTKTDSDAQLTFFGQQDANYVMRITDSVAGVMRDYNGTVLTVKIPLDAENTSISITPFSITVTSLASETRSGLTADETFTIFSDTTGFYKFIVDGNSDYGSTSKFIQTKGGAPTEEYQPFLLLVASGTTVKFVVQNGIREGLQGITVEIFKELDGETVLVQNGVTDITGSILFFLESDVVYTVKFFDTEGLLLFETANYTVTTTESFFYFNLDLTEVITPTSTGITVSFNPSTQYVLVGVTDLVQTISGVGVNHAVIEFYQWADGLVDGDRNVLLTISQLCATSCTNTTLISSLNADANFNLFVDVNVFTDANASVTNFIKSYSLPGLSAIDASRLFVNAREDFGCSTDPFDPCPLTTLISIVITLFVVGGLVFRFNFVSPPGIAILTMLMLGMFAYVGWFYWVVFALLAIVVLIGIAGRSVAQ